MSQGDTQTATCVHVHTLTDSIWEHSILKRSLNESGDSASEGYFTTILSQYLKTIIMEEFQTIK